MPFAKKHDRLRLSAELSALSRDSKDKLRIPVPAQFLCEHDEIMRRVAKIGSQAGRDSDWQPECLHEAVYEALLSSQTPQESGIVFRDPANIANADVFESWIEVRLFDPEVKITDAYMAYLPEGFEPSFQGLMLALMNSPAAPVDLGFEIYDNASDGPAPSHHDALMRHTTVQSCQYRGPLGSLFIP